MGLKCTDKIRGWHTDPFLFNIKETIEDSKLHKDCFIEE